MKVCFKGFNGKSINRNRNKCCEKKLLNKNVYVNLWSKSMKDTCEVIYS